MVVSEFAQTSDETTHVIPHTPY